jgi:hypothetical protein
MALRVRAVKTKADKKLVYPRKSIDCLGTVFYTNEKGEYHRTDGPAIEWSDGSKEWWVDGKRHRTDGPAVVCCNGHKEWWVGDIRLTEKEFNRKYGTKTNTTSNNVKVEYEVKTVKVPKFVVIDGVKYSLAKES